MSKDSPSGTPPPNRGVAQSFAEVLQQALNLELGKAIQALREVATLAQANPPAQPGVAGPAEWAALLKTLEKYQHDWMRQKRDPVDSGQLAATLATASTYLTTAGVSHPSIPADTIGQARRAIARTMDYLGTPLLAADNAHGLDATRALHVALTAWIEASGDAATVKLAGEIREIEADGNAESQRLSAKRVLQTLQSATSARAALERLALCEIDCEKARLALADWTAPLDALLSLGGNTARLGGRQAQTMLATVFQRRGYTVKELADLVQHLRKQFLQKAKIDADLVAQFSADSAETAARNLKNAANGMERAINDLDHHAERMSQAPLSSASFQQWRDSRNEILDVIEKRLDQAEKTLASLEGFGEQLAQFLRSESVLEGSEQKVVPLLENYSALLQKHVELRTHCRLDGLSLSEILRDEMNRLESAHASMPTLPADWSKPAGHALMLFLAGILTYVIFGSGLLQQPLWNVFGAADAADLLFHPAYFSGLALLMVLTGVAARQVPKRHAERALQRLRKARDGKPFTRDKKTPLLLFTTRVNNALLLSLVVVIAGVCTCWIVAVLFGGMAYATAPKVDCRADTRVYAFSKGFVGVDLKERKSYLVYAKDPAAYLCGRTISGSRSSTPEQENDELLRQIVDSLSALSQLKALDTLTNVTAALQETSRNIQGGVIALDRSAVTLDRIAGTIRTASGGARSMNISTSVQELKTCQQTPDSPDCVLRPLTHAVASLDSNLRALSQQMPGMKIAMETIQANTQPLASTREGIWSLLGEWREAKARHVFNRLGDAALGNKKAAMPAKESSDKK